MTGSVSDVHQHKPSDALVNGDLSEESSSPDDGANDNDSRSQASTTSSTSAKKLPKNNEPNLGAIVNSSSSSIDILVETVLPNNNNNRSQRTTIVNENSSSMDSSTKSPDDGGLKSADDDDDDSPPNSTSSDMVTEKSTALTSAPEVAPSHFQEEEKEEIEDSDVARAEISRNVETIASNNEQKSTSKKISTQADGDDAGQAKMLRKKEKPKSAVLIHGVDREKSQMKKSLVVPSNNNSSSPFAKNTKNQENSSDDDDGSFCALLRDPRVAAGIMFCFCIVAILQVLTVVYLVSDDNDNDQDNNKNDRSIIQLRPSESPTSIPSTMSPTLPKSSQFRSIANLPGSFLIEAVSNCDDCTEDLAVVVPQTIPWSDRQTVSAVQVSSDGRVVVVCQSPIAACGSIHVVDMDLAPHISGNIFYYYLWVQETENQGSAFRQQEDDSRLIISWEGVLPYGYWDPNEPFQVNAQVILSNQQVEICYGEGNTGGGTFQAGYSNYTLSNYANFVPFVGPTFDGNGFSSTFPSHTCQILRTNDRPDDGGVTSTSNPSPQVQQTAWPTYDFKNTRWPTSSPTVTPSGRKTFRPTITQRPSSIPAAWSCVPTVGPCVGNFRDLQRELASQWGRPFGGHTVAICGDMEFAFPVRVLEPNTTVCCASSSSTSCQLSNSRLSSRPILRISQENVTLVGLTFLQTEGRDSLISGGGNSLVIFEKPGYHTIDSCKFSRGYAREYGGNLLVTEATEIRIFNTTFSYGMAEVGGGGAAFQNVRSVHIENSFFLSNLAFDGSGGGMVFFGFDPSVHSYQPPSVYISGTLFEENSATVGAGFQIRDLKFPILSVLNNDFVFNFAADFGGAGAIVNASHLGVTFRSNYGRDNGAGSTCPEFYVEDRANNSFEPDCFDLTGFVELVNGCVPTNGKCAQTEDDLRAALFLTLPGDIVALCGIMTVKDTIVVIQRNITVCCVEGFDCSLDSWDGSKSIMVVLGANFTLNGIQMQRGFSQSRGGNLFIGAAGHHVVQNSRFIGGMAGDYGGNLHVANAESVTISGCTFESGSTDIYGGGAAAFEDTPKVTIKDSSLKNNFVSFEGGAMLFFSSMEQPIPYQEVVIDRTVVENNSAMIGGGFLARNMETLSLTVRDCFFQSNTVEEGSPMGHFHLVSKADLIFRSNMGLDFQGFNKLCSSITVAQIESSTRCTVIPRGREGSP